MKQSSKVMLAAATIWPFVYMLLFMGVAFFAFVAGNNGPSIIWTIIIPLHLLTMLMIIGLTAFYIVNVFRNERVGKDMKVLWAVVIFMGSIFAMPVYWYLYIWRALPVTPGQSQLEAGIRSTYSEKAAAPEAAYVPPTQPPDWR